MKPPFLFVGCYSRLTKAPRPAFNKKISIDFRQTIFILYKTTIKVNKVNFVFLSRKNCIRKIKIEPPKLPFSKSFNVVYITKHIKEGRRQNILGYKETFRQHDTPQFSQNMR